MKASLICPARNKARHVKRCVESLLAQDYRGDLEIVVSVQPSEDDTLEIVRSVASRYHGQAPFFVRECPDGDYKGMAGLNAHLNWIHTQISGDVVINCSADDYVEPGLVRGIMGVFERNNPSYVGAKLRFETPEGKVIGETGFPDSYSRFISAAEAIRHMIGSSASSAWSRDLFEKYGPLRGVEGQDMVLPMMALFERGLYYLDEMLHHHVFHADPENTGVEGQMRAAEGDPIAGQKLAELNGFHVTHHWVNIYRRFREAGHLEKMSREGNQALVERIFGAAENWIAQREHLTLQRIEPMGMRV